MATPALVPVPSLHLRGVPAACVTGGRPMQGPQFPPARPRQHSTSSGLAQPPNCLVGSELQACGRECTHVSVPFNCRGVIRHPVLS